MKKTFITLILITIAISVYAQTYISGIILENTTWDVNGSPYIVEDDVTVPTLIRLNINAGVEVLFQEDKALIINGKIDARGDEIDQIIFDSEIQGENWNGVQIINSTSSIFEYCDISNSKNGGINLSGSSNILIDNCLIHNNTSDEGAGINIKENSSDIIIQHSEINYNDGNIIEEVMIGGGGIACKNSENITIEYNTINHNETGEEGGGIYLYCSDSVNINENSIHDNESLYGDGGGIKVYNGEKNWIQYNQIYSNNAELASGGGIALKTACNIYFNEIFDNTANVGGGVYGYYWTVNRYFYGNEIHHNTALYSGGGILISGEGPYPKIQHCDIYSNEAIYLDGGGINTSNTDSQISYCNIYSNKALLGNGGGVYSGTGSPQILRSVIRDNKSLNGGGIFLFDTAPYIPNPNSIIDRCVITQNEATGYAGGMYVDVTDENDNVSNVYCYNSIFSGNIATEVHGYEIYFCHATYNVDSELKYNCIEDLLENGLYIEAGAVVHEEGNIDENPKFTNPDDYDYYFLPDSPCIDTGHPDWPLDPDGTYVDMGVLTFLHDCDKKYFHANYNWISFPSLPVNDIINTNQPVSADNIMNIINPSYDYLELLYSNDDVPALEYNIPDWTPHDPIEYDLKSSRGYKLKTEDPENTQITIEGLRLEEDTDIDLQYGENWVGYWLPNSQDLDVAFGDDLDKVYSIKAEDWEWKEMRPVRGVNDPTPIYYPIRPLQYGKGYVITMKESISDFQWQPGLPAMVEEIPIAQGFEYNVLPDYETVIIDTIEGGNGITEVGAFVDDVCVGAAVVEEYPVQLLAYTDGVSRSSGLTFQVIGGERGVAQNTGYSTLDLETGNFKNMSLFPGRFEHNIVRLNIKTQQEPEEEPIPNVFNLERNYPNPFNPTTTIPFSIAQANTDVSLEIFNIKGQKVKTLYSGIAEEGKHSILWNGKDTNDKSVSSGIYFYKLTTGKKELTRKMLMLK